MAAAAAPMRKQANSQGKTGSDQLWPWIGKGYLAWPMACRRLKRCLIPTQVYIIEELLWETANAPGRPEWAKLTEEWFADQIGCTVQQASECLKALEFRAKLIESRKSGRGKEYRVLGERLSLIEERERRTIEKKSEPKPVGRGKFIVSSGQPMEYVAEQPVSKVLIETRDGQSISYDASESDSILRLVAKAELETISPVMVSGPGSGRRRPKLETITPVMVSPPETDWQKELQELLTPIFLDLYHRKPDDILLHQVHRELNGASIEHYGRLVHKRIRHNTAQIKSGLFVVLARETAQAAAEIEKRHPKPEPAPKPSTFVSEPEHSNSPWAKIRRESSQHVTPVEYSNWFAHSRHGKLDLGRNELTVLVPDEIAAQTLKEEYEVRLLRWSAKAGFPLNNIFFKVAEEDS